MSRKIRGTSDSLLAHLIYFPGLFGSGILIHWTKCSRLRASTQCLRKLKKRIWGKIRQMVGPRRTQHKDYCCGEGNGLSSRLKNQSTGP